MPTYKKLKGMKERFEINRKCRFEINLRKI